MSQELSSKCRTCLSESNFYYQLFDYVEENYKIIEMLEEVVPQIDMKASSQFSTLVCQMCVDKLLTGYKFQQLCIETNTRLHDLLAIPVVDTKPNMEKMLDPLNAEPTLKMKGIEQDTSFDSGIPPNELDDEVRSDKSKCVPDNGSGSDTDSGNEKLSVLKERSTKEIPLEIEKPENPLKLNRRKGYFPCTECGKDFTSSNRLKRHTYIHNKKLVYSCEIPNASMRSEKNCKVQQNDSIENNDVKEFFETQNVLDEVNDSKGDEIDCKDSEELLTFQCPDCTQCFEKKASLSAHYKMHKKQKLLENKSTNFEPELQDIEKKSNEVIEKISKLILKEEIVISSQIFDAVNKESNDDSENDLSSKTGTKKTKSKDICIGEVEKPKSSNKGNGNFPCEVCGKIFDRPYRLKRHNSVHSLANLHECEICKYRFVTANILKAHLFHHKNETEGNFHTRSRPEGFKCPDCPRRFEKQASLSAHRQTHTRNTSKGHHSCTVCQRNFMSRRSITEHITKKHPEAEKYKCDQCDKMFVLHAHLVEHLNRHKSNRKLTCKKKFEYNKTLKEQMRTHSSESTYLCPQCGKTFGGASNLRQHMERHTGLKKYQCPECPSRFNCKSDLITHAATHSNSKPHVCDICGSRFTRAYSLKKHKRLHSGERPFKCDQCNMTFAIIYPLQRHMRTHTGEKPYKCKYCERAYAESGDLTKHLRTHVGENTYMCDQCPMAFKYQAELRQHQSQHYKMAQKLLQQSQKLSEETEHQITEQGQQNSQQQSEFSIQEQQQNNQPDHIQHLPIGILDYQQISLVDHSQQLPPIVEHIQNHTKFDDIVVPRQLQNLDIKSISN